MSKKKLADDITTLIEDKANNNPPPIKCVVKKNYENDKFHIDVETVNGIIKYVPCLFDNEIGRDGVLIFLDGKQNKPLALIETRSDE